MTIRVEHDSLNTCICVIGQHKTHYQQTVFWHRGRGGRGWSGPRKFTGEGCWISCVVEDCSYILFFSIGVLEHAQIKIWFLNWSIAFCPYYLSEWIESTEGCTKLQRWHMLKFWTSLLFKANAAAFTLIMCHAIHVFFCVCWWRQRLSRQAEAHREFEADGGEAEGWLGASEEGHWR